jgi:predicted neuraminidase
MTATWSQGRWSEPRAVIGAREAARALGRSVRKLGNAGVYRDSKGDPVIVFASVSIGGWSGASLNLMRSTDEGETWSGPRRLVTSPVFDISTLVRSPPLPMSDGSILVPAYDELRHPYPSALMLSANGRVVGHRRIGASRHALQPVVVRFDDRSARAYMRAKPAHWVFVSDTSDAGRSWSDLTPIDIPSLDNPVAVERLDGDHLLVVYSARGSSDSDAGPLTLALSADGGRTWRPIHAISHDKGHARYPWLIAGPDGNYHLLYTRTIGPGSEIVHVRFSRDWLAARGGPPCR